MQLIKSVFYKLIYQRNINYLLRNLNKLFYPWLTKVRLHPSGRLNITTTTNKKIHLYTNQTDFVAFCVFWDGLYNYEYLDIFEKVMTKSSGFIDVGANAGLFSLVARAANKNIKVIAADPSFATSYYVPKNIGSNRFDESISFHNVALSNSEEEMTFYEVKNPKYSYLEYNLGGASSLYEKPKAYLERKVKVTTIDLLVESDHSSIESIDFVKIDAEGAEPQIIQGMQDTIRVHKPIIVCEILFSLIEAELEAVFRNHGYDFYYHTEEGLTHTNSIIRETDNGVRNCFFVHPDKKGMIEEFIVSS